MAISGLGETGAEGWWVGGRTRKRVPLVPRQSNGGGEELGRVREYFRTRAPNWSARWAVWAIWGRCIMQACFFFGTDLACRGLQCDQCDDGTGDGDEHRPEGFPHHLPFEASPARTEGERKHGIRSVRHGTLTVMVCVWVYGRLLSEHPKHGNWVAVATSRDDVCLSF